MNAETQQAKFEGWALVEVMGHHRYAGYVTTEAYGQAVLFRVDVPALEERERVTKRPGYIGDQYVVAGATVKEGAVQGYSKLVGSGSIYCITPCTQEAALKAVESMQERPLMLVSLPPEKAIAAGSVETAAGDLIPDEIGERLNEEGICDACGQDEDGCTCDDGQ